MTNGAMSPLRRRMIEDMTIREFTPKTQHDYVQRIKNFAAVLGRSPDTASFEDVRRDQAKPQQTTMQLSTIDPKVNSPECLAIREKALTYDDRVGERVAIGIAAGLLLGPFGLPIAAGVDAAQNKEREAFNREIELRCMTNPPPRPKREAEPAPIDAEHAT